MAFALVEATDIVENLRNTDMLSDVAEIQRHRIVCVFMSATLQLHIPNIVVATCIKLGHQALHGRWGGAPFHGRDLLGRAVRGGASGLGRILNTAHRSVNHCYGRLSSCCLRHVCCSG